MESSESPVLDSWSARKVRPIVMLYVGAVFAVFIVVAHFVFHSLEAVTALAMAAVGGIFATLPGMIDRAVYQLTQSGVEKRTRNAKNPGPFKTLFRWDELSRVVPMRHGFKYYKTMDETNSFRRFWKTHFSDQWSGEVHVEKEDLGRVLELVERRGITIA